MKDAKKFKEKLIALVNCVDATNKKYTIEQLGGKFNTKFSVKIGIELMRKLEKMYEELNEKPITECIELEKTGKPIVYCKGLETRLKGYDYFNTVIWHTKKGLVQKYFTNNLEEKDGMLITDDFIFIKENK